MGKRLCSLPQIFIYWEAALYHNSQRLKWRLGRLAEPPASLDGKNFIKILAEHFNCEIVQPGACAAHNARNK